MIVGVEMDGSRTGHMAERMRQRRITEDAVSVILELGEWNRRADRLVLSVQACALEETALRKEILALERQAKKPLQ